MGTVSGVHPTSLAKIRAFVDVCLPPFRHQPLEILDFGSQVVDEQGVSYRPLFDDPAWRYRGLDITAGHNVDVVVADAYDWSEVESDSVDLVISGQAFEHVEFVWASMFEIARVLRPGGVCVVIAPSGGPEHRYPLDCWRFYPDGMVALGQYVGCDVLESFTDWDNGEWADSILVARKPIWSTETRAAFEARAAAQRAVLADPTDGGVAVRPCDFQGAESHRDPSVLVSLDVSPLRPILVDQQREGLAAQEAEAAAEIESLVAGRIEALLGPPNTLVNRYLRIRPRIAQLAGENLRARYRALRGRE